jgi:hypothetical protein
MEKRFLSINLAEVFTLPVSLIHRDVLESSSVLGLVSAHEPVI